MIAQCTLILEKINVFNLWGKTTKQQGFPARNIDLHVGLICRQNDNLDWSTDNDISCNPC